LASSSTSRSSNTLAGRMPIEAPVLRTADDLTAAWLQLGAWPLA
jgi:hypothetical protein